MSAVSTWKSTLKFSQRMTNTLQIAEAYQRAFPENDDLNARSEARNIEENALQSSASQEDYNKRCRDILLGYEDTVNESGDHLKLPLQPPDQDLPMGDDVSLKPVTSVGPYNNCAHHYTGLFSTIYRCPKPGDLAKYLAIKVTSPTSEQLPHNSKREARILTTLHHANILPLISSHTIPNRTDLLLIFPFLPLTLADCLQSPSPIPKIILRDLFVALDYIHRKNILHRDIKPSNILLHSQSGPALLADFGIAWTPGDPASEASTEKITDIGTTCYRAPELLFGCRTYNTGVDMWAAGCVAAEVFHHNFHSHATPQKGHEWTLFSAGELGSELALVKSIFETLGTPTEATWPETKDLPDWGKVGFVQFPAKPWDEILPGVAEHDRDLVRGLVRYESGDRWSAAACIGS